jgi:hypothetical protein
MTRLLACLVAAAVLAGCGLAATPEKSHAAVLVGVSDQDPTMFTDQLFTDLGIRHSRYLPSWDVALRRRATEAGWLDQWLKAAEAAGVEPLISFNVNLRSKCPKRPCKLPTVSEYRRAFKAFHKRWPDVKEISPWNEANHRSQPTFKNPKRAAQFYNVVRAACPTCTIVAADVIDEVNMERWLKEFRKTAKRPRIWGLHNYRDTNKRKGQRLGGTKRLLDAVRGAVWLTETGGIVKFVLPDGRRLFRKSESRANRATRRMFALAKRYRSRIKRLYIYHWKQSSKDNRFDAGLVRLDGTPRFAYYTVKHALETSIFNP